MPSPKRPLLSCQKPQFAYALRTRHPALFVEMRLGKAQPLDAKILTPTGYVTMGEVGMGDEVIGSDGFESQVTKVQSRGKMEIFEVEFSDRSKTKCTKDHLWYTSTPLQRWRDENGSVKSLHEIKKCLFDINGNRMHHIPMVEAIHFKRTKNLPIRPHLLGLLLGDGGLSTPDSVTFTTADEEILKQVWCALPKGMEARKIKNDNYGYRLVDPTRPTNRLLDSLRRLELMGKKSEKKFIPKSYLLSSIKSRTSLLQGLLDTDGSATTEGTIEYSTSSPQLSKDVRFLVQALGGVIRTKIKKTTHLPSYRSILSLPAWFQPFRLQRKAVRCRRKRKYPPTRAFQRIKSLGKAKVQCIQTSAPNGLYITDDCIVTHNTLVVIRRALLYKPLDKQRRRILIVAPSSALGSWKTELLLESQKDFVYLMGSRKKRLALLEEDHTWNLLNKEGYQALPEVANRKWDAVIADESTFLKNPKAKVTKFFLKHFRQVPHRWALTGLPNPESDLEFWTQLAWLDGRAFDCRSYWQFLTQFFEQRFLQYGWQPKVGTQSFIRREVGKRACILRRKDVDMDRPKIYETRSLELPADLKKIYKKAEQDFVLELDSKSKTTIYAPVRTTWLRQLCGGFLDGKLVWPGKVEEVVYLLRSELRNEKVIVWFDYNQELHAVEQALDKKGILSNAVTGKDSRKTRQWKFQDWRVNSIRILLVQQRIAQTGMDLSAADTNIYYSSPLGLHDRKQTEDRSIHPSKKTAVLYLDLVVKNSVEQDFHRALFDKSTRCEQTLRRAMLYNLNRRYKHATQTSTV